MGYGGTAEEMQRLIDDANRVKEANGEMADLSIDSFADIAEAIHIVQTEMGITGTTAKEAASTIEGSLSMMKGAWQNLVVGMADSNANMSDLINDFVSAASTVLENLLPRIQIALNGVVEMVSTLGPQIIAAIPGIVSSLLPAVISAATNLITSVASMLPGLVQVLVGTVIPALLSGLTDVINSVISALPMVISAICGALPTLVPMLIEACVSIILTLCAELPNMIQPIIAMLPSLLMSVTTSLLENLPILLEAVTTLILALCEMLPELILPICEMLPEIIVMITTALLELAPQLFDAVGEIVMACLEVIWGLFEAVPGILANYYNTWIENMSNLVSLGWAAIVSLMSEGVELCIDYVKRGWDMVKTVTTNLWNSLKNVISNAWTGIKSAVTVGINAVKNTMASVGESIKSTASNIWAGIREKMETPINKAKTTIKAAISAIEGFFANMKLKFPDIKLPHFKMSGSFSFNPPSVPSIDVEWYRKAMNSPMLLNGPTIFGFNPASGKMMGAGEAGSEVVSGANTLMGMIGDAVESRTAVQNDILVAILNAITGGNQELIDAILSGHTLQIGEREFGRLVKEYA